MICPGCGVPGRELQAVSLWFDALGRFRGTCAVCPTCAVTMRDGSRAAQDMVMKNVESALRLAGTPLTPGSH